MAVLWFAGISLTALVLACAGVYLIAGNSVRRFLIMKKLQREEERRVRKRTVFERKIDEMLLLFPKLIKIGIDSEKYLLISLTLGAVMFALSAFVMPPWAALIPCMAGMGMPFGILWICCETERSKIANEGIRLISMLLSAYRVNDYNILEAMEYLIKQKSDLPHTAPVISVMLIKLRQSDNRETVSEALDNFAGALGSNWAKMLALNIEQAYMKGTNIAIALEEIMNQLRDASALMQESLRMNNESVRMTVFMIPLSMLITAVLAMTQMGLTPDELIRNQFSDGISCMLFLAIVVLFAVNISAVELLKNKRIDI